MTVFQYDGIFTNKAHTADMTVQVDADTWPVQPGCYLFHVSRFASAMEALHHDAAVVGKTSKKSECRIVVEAISIINIRNMLASLAEGRHLQVRVEAKMLTHRDINIRFLKWVTQVAVVMGGFFPSQNPYDRYSQFSVMSRCAI